MLHLLGVTAGRRGRIASRLATGCRPTTAAAALGRVERRRAVLALGDRHAGVFRRTLVEHHILFALEHERSLGAHDDLAIIAEAVAVDRGIGDDDLLVLVLVVARGRILVHAVDVVVDLTICRKDTAIADRRHRQRLDLLALAMHGRHKNTSGVELMAAQLRHQASAGAVPEPPADELFHGRPRAPVGQSHRRVAILGGIDQRVGDLGLELCDSLREHGDVGGLGGIEVLLPADKLLGKRLIAGHRWLPAVVAGQVAAVPLGPDRMQVAKQAGLADRVDRVVVEHAVMPLVAGGEDFARLP